VAMAVAVAVAVAVEVGVAVAVEVGVAVAVEVAVEVGVVALAMTVDLVVGAVVRMTPVSRVMSRVPRHLAEPCSKRSTLGPREVAWMWPSR
jgi:hypothetical protein